MFVFKLLEAEFVSDLHAYIRQVTQVFDILLQRNLTHQIAQTDADVFPFFELPEKRRGVGRQGVPSCQCIKIPVQHVFGFRFKQCLRQTEPVDMSGPRQQRIGKNLAAGKQRDHGIQKMCRGSELRIQVFPVRENIC